MALSSLVKGAALAAVLTTPVLGQTYVGDGACAGCHANMPYTGFFDGYMDSGHPWKLFQTAGDVPAANTWPFTPVPPLPNVAGVPLEWSDVEYVIGNYFWKARFIDREGYIWTGGADDRTQWNIATEEFVPYHPGETRPFNCGRCHTTGYDPAGNQGGLPGLVGTWAQDGVRCEACHGPASEHIANPSVHPTGGKLCSECHYRDDDFRMPWSGGFMRHHQQAEEFSHSPHRDDLDCMSCHNPHKSTVYGLGGMTASCSTCHPGEPQNGYYDLESMQSVACTDCHMPKLAKSAVAFNAHKADVTGHLFRIMTEPIMASENVYQDGGSTFWNQNAKGESWITLDYACLGCHTEIGLDLTIQDAAAYAANIHSDHAACVADVTGDGLVDFPDILRVLVSWGTPDADVNRDGTTDGDDLGIVLQLWGECP